MVETQSERKIKKLRTDNGLEFCNLRFNSFCKDEGVVRHRTCTYTPQQNGVAERLNRTIMNKVRSMLSESGFELKFWAESAATAVYLINRSPSSAINFEVPEERWSSVMPDLTNLKRFGCLAFVHTSDGKLNPRAKRGYFTGYPDGVKGFKVWLQDDKKVVISRDVVFKEDTVYKNDKSKTSESGQSGEVPNLVRLELSETGGSAPVGGATDNDVSDGVENGTPEDEDVSGEYQLAKDRPRRQIVPPKRFEDYECEAADGEDIYACYICDMSEDTRAEPTSWSEAMDDPDSDFWTEAAGDEMISLKKNGTWVLVDRPKGQKTIGCKWVFKRKAGITGVKPPRYKGRLVAKGYSQKEGIDFQEIFAPVVKHVSIRYILSAVAHFDMELHQMDVKTAFLHGLLDETIYMDQPEGFIDKKYPEKVCLLKRSLYGLKQSPRQWNRRFDDFVKTQGYVRSEYDMCVYFKVDAKGV